MGGNFLSRISESVTVQMVVKLSGLSKTTEFHCPRLCHYTYMARLTSAIAPFNH